MKIVLDERLKHRLIGVAVMLSLGAIFVPALFKNAGHRFDDNRRIAVALPGKPQLPRINPKKEEALFKKMNVAHVQLPGTGADPQAPTVARARQLSPVSQPDKVLKENALVQGKSMARNDNDEGSGVRGQKVQLASVALANASSNAVMKASRVNAVAARPRARTSSVMASNNHPARLVRAAVNTGKNLRSYRGYTVQLGLFSRKQNADSLVKKLKVKGYTAYMVKLNGKNGALYKVFAGQLAEKHQAFRLQQQLASALNVKGFVVSGNEAG